MCWPALQSPLNFHTGTSAGQDLNLSIDRVNSNRNLTNKLWNAGKFILLNLEKVDDEEWDALSKVSLASPESWEGLELGLSERWLLSKLHEVKP